MGSGSSLLVSDTDEYRLRGVPSPAEGGDVPLQVTYWVANHSISLSLTALGS